MIAALLAGLLAPVATAEDWDAWRGPAAVGVAATAVPTEWSDERNVAWKVAVPGRGFSTPIVHAGVIYLTTAVPLADGAPTDRDAGASGEQVENDFTVLAYGLADGAPRWSRAVRRAIPHEGYHGTYGSHASASPITDGERLYASFGSFGIYALDLATGEVLWQRDLGVRLQMRRQFGEGAAPVLAGDLLVQVCDHEGDSFAVALDKRTGEEKWRVARDEPSVWAMPLVTDSGGEQVVVCAGTTRVRAYRATDGKLLWECAGLGLNAIPAVVRSGEDVLVMSGYQNANLMCIRLGGEGDLTGTEAVRWQSQKGCAYTASPVLKDGLYYSVSDRGMVSCFDAATGEPQYLEERLPRGSTLKASPLAAGDHLYVATESGDVHVLKLGRAFEVERTNTLEDQFFVASPVAVDGKLLLRGATQLFCIAEKP